MKRSILFGFMVLSLCGCVVFREEHAPTQEMEAHGPESASPQIGEDQNEKDFKNYEKCKLGKQMSNSPVASGFCLETLDLHDRKLGNLSKIEFSKLVKYLTQE